MDNSTKNKKKKRGFTLVELVIVLAVMGIIALIAIPSLAGTKEHFKVKADQKSCDMVQRAVKLLITDETIADNVQLEIKYVGAASDTAKGTATILKNAGADVSDTNKAKNATEIKAEIENALQGVKSPQATPTGYYSIEINNGTVEVKIK